MTQLTLLNLPEIDPRVQLAACRRLAKLVRENRRSFKVQDYAKRRSAMLSYSRRSVGE